MTRTTIPSAMATHLEYYFCQGFFFGLRRLPGSIGSVQPLFAAYAVGLSQYRQAVASGRCGASMCHDPTNLSFSPTFRWGLRSRNGCQNHFNGFPRTAIKMVSGSIARP
jgi:predicted CxxxxCH...CXXCH cytochrome family protein